VKKDLCDFIRSLTAKDKKTLSQKALKTTEEVGELAKAILPFENADGTKHRFSNKEKIIEESIDVILCALSIAYELGADDDRIEELMWRKSEFWSQLQLREQDKPFPLPFELHVTVDKNSDFEKFKNVCNTLGIKAISLDLQDLDGNTVLDEMMTTSKVIGDTKKAMSDVYDIRLALEKEGFNVVREKIETVVWHPAAPSSNGGKQDVENDEYFESHIEVLIKPDSELQAFKNMVYMHNGHIAYNKRKVYSDGTKKVLVTLRGYRGSTVEKFKDRVTEFCTKLERWGFEFDKPLLEYSIYDTNVKHDQEWMKNA
jgi:NTP pyrophosphatase (non-canonical NTP hydrolase)